MPSLLLVVNPASNGGRTVTHLPEVCQALEAGGWDVTVQLTESAPHATDILRACLPGQLVAVLAGDGVLARALEGAYESGAVVAPLSGGRGNDQVRALGIPTDPVEAARRLGIQTREQRIDIGLCNGRFFAGVACVGIAAAANEIANNTRWIRGTAVYLYGVIRSLLTFRPVNLTIIVDGVAGNLRSWNVAIGNSESTGGGLRICRGASFTDGFLEMNALQGRPIPWMIPVLLRVFDGSHVSLPGVFQKSAREIQISGDQPLPVWADGEHIADLPATFTVEPAAVTVLA